MGIKKYVDSSVLSRANERRNWMIFDDFGNYLIQLVRPLYANCPIPNLNLDNEIFALVSTTISVSINLFTWAEGKYSRGTVKMHTLIDLRGNIPEFIFITDVSNNELLTCLTNNFDVSALEVASLYKNRRQIEIFFKWIKQNLTAKKLWGIHKMQLRYNFGLQFVRI